VSGYVIAAVCGLSTASTSLHVVDHPNGMWLGPHDVVMMFLNYKCKKTAVYTHC